MVTGIEIAGLTLGAFPLAIEAIKFYSRGIRTIKDIKNYQQVLGQFARDLRVENCKFENNCLCLLSEFLSPEHVKIVMENPEGDEWHDEEFLRELKDQLKPAEGTLDSWLCRVKQLHDTLDLVAGRFKLPVNNKKKALFRKSATFNPRQAWDVGMLTSYRDEHISKIRQWNMDLETLASWGKKALSGSVTNLSSRSKPNLSNLMTYHKRIRYHAKSVYNILREKLEYRSCRCTVPHTTHLELEMRTPPSVRRMVKAPDNISHPRNLLRFKLMFSTGNIDLDLAAGCQEFQLEHIEEIADPPEVNKSAHVSQVHLQCLARGHTPPSLPAPSYLKLKSRQEKGSPLSRGAHTPTTSVDSISTPLFEPIPPSMSSSTGIFETTNHLSPPSAWKNKIKTPLLWKRKPNPHSSSSSSRPTFPNDSSWGQPTPVTSLRAITENTSPRVRRTRSADEDSSLTGPKRIDPTHLPAIDCLCTAIKKSAVAPLNPIVPTSICLGLLVGIDSKKHRIWLPSQRALPPSPFISLAKLMTTLTECPSQKSRRILGVKQMSSLLQLGSTKWLTETWGAEDILFPMLDPETQNHDFDTCILSRPFIYRKFNTRGASSNGYNPQQTTSSDQQQARKNAIAVTGCNKSLYSLGILLLELFHWRRLESLRGSAVTSASKADVFVAYRLSDKLFDDAGYTYGSAVRACIRGLPMHIPKADLENDTFRKEVYLNVMVPLEEDLKAFCNCQDLKEIMEEE